MSRDLLSGKRLVFLGGGNMAEALIRGALAGGVCEPGQVTVADILPERLAHLRERYGVATETDNRAAAAVADVVLLAVKPQQLAGVLEGIRPVLPAAAVVISIVAGVRASRIEGALAPGQRVVRVMPNTPSLIGQGAAAVAAGTHADAADVALAAELLGAVGYVTRVEESQLDAVTAVSGSGPAYVFHLIESMMEAGTGMGLDPETARALVVRTVEGAARLVRETGEDPAVLRARVTSKAGTTEAAIRVLEQHQVRAHVIEALRAACTRSRELSAL
jgi:pyrroline-5-carboxylate reductase